ncbi:HNH endonuclease signature motif containing protein [Alsobacter sp. R-9]
MRNTINMAGQRFGRLIVRELVERTPKTTIWRCICDCGGVVNARRTNLMHGHTQSCGCFAREVTSARFAAARASRPQAPPCCVEGCGQPAREYDKTLCRKHGQRMRRYGDPLFVTPEDVRLKRLRDANLANHPTVKPTTYRKFYGRHEHRVIGEQIAGRKLHRNEHVHHIDGNKHNNDPSNLMVLSSEEHARLHAMEKRNA